MDRSFLINRINNKRVKDYSFTIGFFVVFSFFVIFAIRPNLTTAFNLEKELAQLREVDKNYEDAIIQIVSLQSIMEQNRDKFYLLDDAIPARPRVNKVIDDVSISASQAGVTIKKMNVSEVSLKENQTKNDKQSFRIAVDMADDFGKAESFIETLLSQRRLKTVHNISIKKDDLTVGSSSSAVLKIQMEIDGYYL